MAGRAWKHLSLRRPLSIVLIPNSAEPTISQYIRNVSGRCFIDVGANAGMYAIRYRDNFERIYAVEPHPRMVRALRTKIMVRMARNISILPFAASDQNAVTQLFLDGTVGRSAGSADTIEPNFIYRPASSPNLTVHYPKGNQGKTSIVVQARRLDSYPFPSPDLVKIDVEGAEFRVLAGAEETLKRTERVIVELHDRQRQAELWNYLNHRLGFRTKWIAPDHILGERD